MIPIEEHYFSYIHKYIRENNFSRTLACGAVAGRRFFLLFFLLDNDVRRREEDRYRGNNREQREYDQTKAVHHHRRKLPITDEVGPLVGLPHAARDELQLAQNELQLALRRRADADVRHGVVQRRRRHAVQECGRRAAAAHLPEVVVHVQHVGQQALGRAVFQFKLFLLFVHLDCT
jgi:hypothetical protein